MKVQSEEYFGAIASNFGSVPWHMLALVITFVIMVFGVSKGIEKVNKFLMPLFFGLFLILAVRVFFLEGSAEGYQFLLKPEWSMLAEPKTWIYALGQAFFSLSLAGCGTIVYGSYLKKEENIIARVDPRTASRQGAKIKVAFELERLHFFDKDTEITLLTR